MGYFVSRCDILNPNVTRFQTRFGGGCRLNWARWAKGLLSICYGLLDYGYIVTQPNILLLPQLILKNPQTSGLIVLFSMWSLPPVFDFCVSSSQLLK